MVGAKVVVVKVVKVGCFWIYLEIETLDGM